MRDANIPAHERRSAQPRSLVDRGPELCCMKLAWPFGRFESVPDDPFYQPRKPLWLPPEMATPPLLDERCFRKDRWNAGMRC